MTEPTHKTTDEFLEAARAKHKQRFDYTGTELAAKVGDEITITCPLHGAFQVKPRQHLLNKHGGCKKCVERENKRRQIENCANCNKKVYEPIDPAQGLAQVIRPKYRNRQYYVKKDERDYNQGK